MFKLRAAVVVLAAASTLSACKDDGPLGVNSGDPLTEDEIQAVFVAISGAFSSLSLGPAASGPARATIPVNESFNGSGECPIAGGIDVNGSVNGTVDDATFELDVTYRLRMTPNGCAVDTETATITLDGAPYIQFDADFLFTETLIDVSGTQTGGISFTSSDGRSGSCAFDVTFSVTANLDTQQGSSSASGSVCGVSAAGLEVWSID